LYLGRKNCVPTEFIYQGVFDVLEAAEHQANHLANTKNRTISFRVYEGDCSEALGGELLSLNDVPVQFGERKIYRDRRVTVVSS
jgi:CRISPR system Cascade subunit CasD